MIFKEFLEDIELLSAVYYLVEAKIDDDLVARVQAGDESALGELIMRWQPRIAGFVAKKYAWDSDATDDISQETMMRVVNALRTGTEVQHFPAWIMRIAKNTAASLARKEKKYGIAVDDPETLGYDQGSKRSGPAGKDAIMDKEDPTQQSVEDREAIDAMMQSMGQMKDLHRDALKGRFFDYETEDDAAKRLDVPKGTVKRRVHGAKRELEKLMRGKGFGEQ